MVNSKEDLKTLVQRGYDQISDQYAKWTESDVSDDSPRLRYTREVLKQLPTSNTSVLELGCGSGVPVLTEIVKTASRVFANDISQKQIELARSRCPNVTFFPGDMTTLQFDTATLDAVFAYYCLFHIPRHEQGPTLSLIWSWLKPGGFLALSLGADELDNDNGDFLGAHMAWSNWGAEKSKKLVTESGFELLKTEILDGSKNDDPDDPDYGTKFIWMLAQRPVAH